MLDKITQNKIKNLILSNNLDDLQKQPAISNGMDINERLTNSDKTALIIAAREGHLSIVCWLLDHGADLSLTDDEGRTAVMRACEEGHIEIVVLLVHRGADIFQWNIWGRTPLMMAACCGHTPVVRFLVASGAELNACSIDGKSALRIAVERDFPDVVSFLLETGCTINDNISSEKPIVQMAAAKCSVETMDLLVRNGADITDGLCAASASGNIQVVSHLIALGANYDATDHKGWTPLMYSCAFGQIDTMSYLISQGAQLRFKNREGGSAITLASRNCKNALNDDISMNDLQSLDEKVLWLLRHGTVDEIFDFLADSGVGAYSTVDNEGQNILFLAASEGRCDILNSLFEHEGCDVNCVRLDGYSPIMVASANGQLDAVVMLHIHGAEINFSDSKLVNSIILASRYGFSTLVEYFIKVGADIESKDISGKTPLMFACQGGHLQAASVLLAKGAAVDSTDKNGKTALTFASVCGNIEIVKLLVSEYNADADIVDATGKTVIYHANEEEHYDIVTYLFVVKAKKSLFVVMKHLKSKHIKSLEIGLKCLESIVPYSEFELMENRPASPSAELMAVFNILCSENIIDVLKRLKQHSSENIRARASTLLKLSMKYQEHDIFNAIKLQDWDRVLSICEKG